MSACNRPRKSHWSSSFGSEVVRRVCVGWRRQATAGTQADSKAHQSAPSKVAAGSVFASRDDRPKASWVHLGLRSAIHLLEVFLWSSTSYCHCFTFPASLPLIFVWCLFCSVPWRISTVRFSSHAPLWPLCDTLQWLIRFSNCRRKTPGHGTWPYWQPWYRGAAYSECKRRELCSFAPPFSHPGHPWESWCCASCHLSSSVALGDHASI